MKRKKAPDSTPASGGQTAQAREFSKQETEQNPKAADNPAVPLALSYDPLQPGPKPQSLPRTVLKRSDVPAILFEPDDVPNVSQAEAPAKFSTGPVSEAAAAPQAPEVLPEFYGTGRLLLTARDPKCLYAHWDLTPDQQQGYAELSGQKHLTLRVHQESLAGPVVTEFPIAPRAHHSFIGIDAPEARRFVADLGYYPPQGSWKTVATAETAAATVAYSGNEPAVQFATIQFAAEKKSGDPLLKQPSSPAQPEPPSRSITLEGFPLPKPFISSGAAAGPTRLNVHAGSIQTGVVKGQPAFGPESLGDVEDMLAEELEEMTELAGFELITASAGSWTAAQGNVLAELIGWSSQEVKSYSSADLLELAGGAWQARPGKPGEWAPVGERELSSAGLPGAPAISKHDFWFNVNAELVIYGATEPGASVTLGGRPVQLRPDGSFSCRFALPDGAYPLALNAYSSRGETREAKLHVSRKTDYLSGTGVHPLDSALQPPCSG